MPSHPLEHPPTDHLTRSYCGGPLAWLHFTPPHRRLSIPHPIHPFPVHTVRPLGPAKTLVPTPPLSRLTLPGPGGMFGEPTAATPPSHSTPPPCFAPPTPRDSPFPLCRFPSSQGCVRRDSRLRLPPLSSRRTLLENATPTPPSLTTPTMLFLHLTRGYILPPAPSNRPVALPPPSCCSVPAQKFTQHEPRLSAKPMRVLLHHTTNVPVLRLDPGIGPTDPRAAPRPSVLDLNTCPTSVVHTWTLFPARRKLDDVELVMRS